MYAFVFVFLVQKRPSMQCQFYSRHNIGKQMKGIPYGRRTVQFGEGGEDK